MAALAGRGVRIAIGATDIAGAKMDGLTINREHIDITDKDDAGIRTLLDGIGTHSVEMTVSGVLKGTALIAWAEDEATVLQTMTFDVPTIGSYTGSFGISTFEHSGSEGAEAATFSASFVSSGAIPFTAAA